MPLPAHRSVGLTLRLLQRLQGAGLPWMSTLKTREQVAQAMHYFMTRVGLDVGALPPAIHIAGTKGKGSTAAMTEAMLRAAGLKTGLFTSPHLVRVEERVRICGAPIDEATYLRHFWGIWDALTAATPVDIPVDDSCTDEATLDAVYHPSRLVLPSGRLGRDGAVAAAAAGADGSPLPPLPPLPGFNYLTLLAFRAFVEAGVDVMVLEVGMGGRLDATNVIDAPAAVGITTLDFDHMEVLGDTLPEIAREKAGIFKPGVPAVTAPQRADALAALVDEANGSGTPLFLADEGVLARRGGSCADGDAFPELGLLGRFQRTNAAVATALVDLYTYQVAAGRVRGTARGGASESSGSDALPAGSSPVAPATEATARRRGSSAFTDDYGSATSAPAGVCPCPPPVFEVSPPRPLSSAQRQGLKVASWPGRAQVVPIPLPPSSPPGHSLTLYLDGAHTERSMVEAAGWFAGQLRAATAAAPNTRHVPVLAFYCGFEKDALQLLLPLSTQPFASTFVTKVDWVLTPRKPMPSFDDALEAFLSRKRKMEDAVTIQEVADSLAAAQAAPGAGSSGVGATPAPVSAPGDPLAWQRTLTHFWAAAHERVEFTLTRQRLAREVAEAAGDASAAAAASSVAPCRGPGAAIRTSFKDVFEEVYAQATSPSSADDSRPVAYHVLVTGSLYLVGSALELAQARGAAGGPTGGAAAPAATK